MTADAFMPLIMLALAILTAALAGGAVGYLFGFNRGRRHRWRR